MSDEFTRAGTLTQAELRATINSLRQIGQTDGSEGRKRGRGDNKPYNANKIHKKDPANSVTPNGNKDGIKDITTAISRLDTNEKSERSNSTIVPCVHCGDRLNHIRASKKANFVCPFLQQARTPQPRQRGIVAPFEISLKIPGSTLGERTHGLQNGRENNLKGNLPEVQPRPERRRGICLIRNETT